MKRLGVLLAVPLVLVSTMVFAAPAPPTAQVFVFSNSSPNVTVVDGQTHRILRTADVLKGAVWAWNEHHNYFDGTYLWLGLKDPKTNQAHVVLFDIERLQIAERIPLGEVKGGFFFGKLSRTGRLFVAKFRERQLLAIDIKSRTVVKTLDLPISAEGVACDADTAMGMDNKEHVYIPGAGGKVIVSVDTTTLQVDQVLKFETKPWMVTRTPDGRRIWVQEIEGANVVLNTIGMLFVERIPTGGKEPDSVTFSPDGQVAFTGHLSDVIVTANDAQTFAERWRTRVGANTSKLGVHPAGTFLYVLVDQEGALAVLDAKDGRLVNRVMLGTNPNGIFVRAAR
jgi:DNA-binding beta-propeller fold protein YncE